MTQLMSELTLLLVAQLPGIVYIPEERDKRHDRNS